MKIVHRISFSTNAKIIEMLENLGIKVDKDELISIIYIDETDKRFREVKEIFTNYRHIDLVSTKFTKKEKDNAEYLVLKPTWVNEYPMPEDKFGYIDETYDTSLYCAECNIGLKQKNPFLLKGEPKWGKKDFLRLFWVEDEIFMKKSSYEQYLKPIGIEFTPVLHYKTKKTLETIIQLNIKNQIGIDLKDYQYQICSNCHQRKYKVINRGFFPKLKEKSRSLIMRTEEYFGHDGLAFNYLIVHNEIYKAITQNKLKGIDFIPIEK